MTSDTPHKEEMNAYVRALAAEFPDLQFSLDTETKNLDFYGEFTVQPGLEFKIGVALEWDSLHLYVGALKLEYFPVTKPSVLEEFACVIRGLLRGRYRVVEFSSDGRNPHKAVLQRKEDGRWQPCGTWSKVRFPSFRRTHETVLMRAEPSDGANEPLGAPRSSS